MTTLLNSQRGVKAHEYSKMLEQMDPGMREVIEILNREPLRQADEMHQLIHGEHPSQRISKSRLALWLAALLVSFSFFAWCCYSQGAVRLWTLIF